ncbi:MAG: gliding motility protein GldL [Bacteroidia bacterium]|nr:gliding motility protein GldL [Bacteroidia bacterium]
MNKFIRKIENALQTDNGQRFLQYAYSFGAAIVIFGAMVKVMHWWGVWGNIIFGTGMVIECIVFILYGLDRTPTAYQAEKVVSVNESASVPVQTHFTAPQPFQEKPRRENLQPAPVESENHIAQLESVADNVTQFAQATQTLTQISESLQESYRHIIDNSQNISHNSLGYVQQMEALNRNISGLNTIYEIQLKSISGQLDTIAQINNGLARVKSMYSEAVPDSSVIKQETERMAEQIRELNQIYGRMIQAMTHPQTP